MKFSDLGLSVELEKTVTSLGYTVPTPIQEQAIPQILRGRDLFGCAQTGTGKTASFILPMIEILHGSRAKVRMPRSIVLEPTRELAAQVLENFEKYGKDHKLKAALLVGGESMAEQERRLKRGVDVLIATPGRLLDLFERGQILLADVKVLVIDEADRMLDMGFIPDVDRIVATLPKIRHTLLFSATMPEEIRKLAHTYLMNPKEIIVAPTVRTAATVTQRVIFVEEKQKREALRHILRSQEVPGPVIIFCNRKRDISVLTASLKRHGFHVAELHGDMHQSQRNKTLEDFKNGKLSILVASDIAARGLDVEGLSLVVNFNLPVNAEDYVHRIGRTGRAGKAGMAITLVSSYDDKNLKDVQAFIHEEIPVMKWEKGEPEAKGPKKRQKSHSEGSSKEQGEKTVGKRPSSKEDQKNPKPSDLSSVVSSVKPEKSPKDKQQREETSEKPFVGFGSEIPAFMRKAVSLKRE